MVRSGRTAGLSIRLLGVFGMNGGKCLNCCSFFCFRCLIVDSSMCKSAM